MVSIEFIFFNITNMITTFIRNVHFRTWGFYLFFITTLFSTYLACRGIWTLCEQLWTSNGWLWVCHNLALDSHAWVMFIVYVVTMYVLNGKKKKQLIQGKQETNNSRWTHITLDWQPLLANVSYNILVSMALIVLGMCTWSIRVLTIVIVKN